MRPVPRVPPFDRPATYADLEALPPHVVGEIVDGELHASPRPASPHTYTFGRLGARLVPAFDEGRGGPGGWVILQEPELHLSTQIVVPDLAGWRRVRMPVVPDVAWFALSPDWICEILSASTASFDRAKKLRVYAADGVGHAWLIDPRLRTLEVLRLEGCHWAIVETHVGDEVVRAEPFEQVPLELSALWLPEEPTRTPA